MAFKLDRHIIERCFSIVLAGTPVDPRYSLEILWSMSK